MAPKPKQDETEGKVAEVAEETPAWAEQDPFYKHTESFMGCDILVEDHPEGSRVIIARLGLHYGEFIGEQDSCVEKAREFIRGAVDGE